MRLKTRVVHLSSVHDGFDTRILHKECRSLALAGFDITFIARAAKDDVVDDVKIRALSASSKKRLVRMTRSVIDVLRKALDENAEVYHFHDPELIPVGLLLKARGKRVIYDVHESLPKQIRSKAWIPKPLRVPVALGAALAEQVGALAFDGIVAATPGIAERFPKGKTVIVQNFARDDECSSVDVTPYQERKRIVTYVGGLSRIRGIREMVEAMGHVTDARLSLAGTFETGAVAHEIRNMPEWAMVDELGWLSRCGVAEAIHRSRVGLVLLRPEPNYLDSYPVKLFEYMLAGLPVVASDFPFWRQFVLDHGAGIMVDPTDPKAIAGAVQWLLDNPLAAEEMGAKGRDAALAMYSWESQSAKLVEFYRERILR